MSNTRGDALILRLSRANWISVMASGIPLAVKGFLPNFPEKPAQCPKI